MQKITNMKDEHIDRCFVWGKNLTYEQQKELYGALIAHNSFFPGIHQKGVRKGFLTNLTSKECQKIRSELKFCISITQLK